MKTWSYEGHQPISADTVSQVPYRKKYGRYVQCNRKRYEIFFVKDLKLANQPLQGLCVAQYQVIFVDVDSNIESTLLHEIIHGDFAEGGIRQMQCWSPDLEELVCEIVAESFSHNFRFSRK
jgi:hypothetical protein